MQESKLLGMLLPAHPDIQPILWTIRQKYGIPDVIPGDDSSREYSISGDKIDWNAVRQELDFRIRFEANLLPPEVGRILMMIEARKKLPGLVTSLLGWELRSPTATIQKEMPRQGPFLLAVNKEAIIPSIRQV